MVSYEGDGGDNDCGWLLCGDADSVDGHANYDDMLVVEVVMVVLVVMNMMLIIIIAMVVVVIMVKLIAMTMRNIKFLPLGILVQQWLSLVHYWRN